MTEVQSYRLHRTRLIPNSPYPLLHYRGALAAEGEGEGDAVKAHDVFAAHGWDTQWIFRYGPTQRAHYHSGAHECMVVLSGTATIRFGAADLDAADAASGGGGGGGGAQHEPGGVELQARAGDVFVIPAGVAHKTFDARPAASLALLTPGDGHHIAAAGDRQAAVRAALAGVSLSGFTMLGAYPRGGVWDSCVGGEHTGFLADLERVWAVPKPDNDPVLGPAEQGLRGLWQ